MLPTLAQRYGGILCPFFSSINVVRTSVTEGQLKAPLSQENEWPSVSNDIGEEESQNSILDNSTQNPSNHSTSSDLEVLVKGGSTPHHP